MSHERLRTAASYVVLGLGLALAIASARPAICHVSDPGALDAAEAPPFNPVTTAYALTSGAGGDLPGCGALSAIDLDSGELLYQSPRLGPRAGLTASEDLRSFVAGGGAGPDRLSFVDARASDPGEWTALELWAPAGPHQLSGSALHIQGEDLYFSARGPSAIGSGVARISLSRFRGLEERADVNPVEAFYSTRTASAFQVLADPFGRELHVLSLESRYPVDPSEAIESFPLHVHTMEPKTLRAATAPLALPPLVVDEPPGAGLREAGVHNWLQNGRIGWATSLPTGGKVYGREGRYVVVSRWARPELIVADLHRKADSNAVVTASLPVDYELAGALAANHGWVNPGLIAVHGGDKIGIFDLDPFGTLQERARIDITPVVSPLTDDRRMMSGPLAWSADGSRLIAAGNEGGAEVLVLDVDDCGARVTLRHAISACPYQDYNGASGFTTANGHLAPPRPQAAGCPRPWWWPEDERVGSRLVIGLPWLSAGR